MNTEINLIEAGRGHITQGNYRLAEEAFEKAIRLNPDSEYAHFELGKICYMQERYAEAIQRLEKALMLNQNNAHSYLLLAKSHKAMRNFRESAGEYSKALGLGCKDGNIYKELFEAYGELDEIDFPENQLNEAIDKGYSRELFRLIQKYNFKGKYGLTKALTPKALNHIPENDIFTRNRLINELEIAQGKTTLISKPRRLTVTLSNKCNLNCIMCLTRHTQWEIPRKIVQEIYSLFPYLEKVMWQGGEVFALDFFEEILSEGFRHPNLRHSIVTNGQLITEKMAERLVTNNVELTVSIDGTSKEVYEYIRRGADFERLTRNLKLISQLRKKYKSNTVLNLNVAVMKSNYRQLPDFIELAKTYGFEFICLMPIHIHLKTSEDIFTNQDMEALDFITEVSPQIEKKAAQYGIRLENRLPRLNAKPEGVSANSHASKEGLEEEKSAKLLCHIPWQQLLIDYDGTVRPDCLCRIEKTAGSLLKNASLMEIWNNDVLQEYRRRIVRQDYDDFCNPICSSGKICESHLKIP